VFLFKGINVYCIAVYCIGVACLLGFGGGGGRSLEEQVAVTAIVFSRELF